MDLNSVILENERDRATFEWLQATYLPDEIETALKTLTGARKPYVSNLVKSLGASVPEYVLKAASKETAKAALASIREKLK